MNAAADNPGLQISDYLRAFRRHRRVMLKIFLLIGVAAIVLATALPSRYTARTVINFQPEKIPGINLETSGASDSYIEQYVGELSRRVLTDANLEVAVEQFDPYPDAADTEEALARLKDDVSVNTVRSVILDPNSGRDREIITAFEVYYTNRMPEKVAPVAAWLGQAYVDADRQNRQERATQTATFYREQADKAAEQIAKLEREVADFKAKNYASLPELAGVNLDAMSRSENQIETMRAQLQALSQERYVLAQQLADARNADSDAAVLRQLEAEYRRKLAAYDVTHPDMVQLSRQIETLRMGGGAGSSSGLRGQLEARKASLATVRQRYSDDHPDVRRLVRDIADLEQRIANGEDSSSADYGNQAVVQLRARLAGIDSQISSLNGRIAEQQDRLRQQESRAEAAPLVEREYQVLNRDLGVTRDRYKELLDRQLAAEVNESAIREGRLDEFRIVSQPSDPVGPSSPNRLLIVIAGLILAALVAFTIAVVKELFDTTIRGARDIESMLGVAPLSLVPSIENSVARSRDRSELAKLWLPLALGTPVLFLAIYFLSR